MTETVAVVPAAGSGERLGAGIAKAFVDLDGRSMLETAVDGLLGSGVIERVVVAVPADRVDETSSSLGARAVVVAALKDGLRAVIPVLPVVDTIKAVDVNGVVLGTPERAGLRAVQTPQGFETGLLRRAYEQASNAAATDDAALVENLGVPVHTVAGDVMAFKITTPLDLQLARAVLAR